MYNQIDVNNDNPKMKKERIRCDKCKKLKICIRSDDSEVCRECWPTTSRTWCMWCEICGHLTLESTYKVCSECHKVTGTCCGKLYHCQSSECICKRCFNYKCEGCGTELDDLIFVSDGGIDSRPLCEKCNEALED